MQDLTPSRCVANITAMTTAADQINRLGGIANFTAMTTAADQINRLGGIANLTTLTTAPDRIKPDSLYYGSGITTGDMPSDTDKPDSPDCT